MNMFPYDEMSISLQPQNNSFIASITLYADCKKVKQRCIPCVHNMFQNRPDSLIYHSFIASVDKFLNPSKRI